MPDPAATILTAFTDALRHIPFLKELELDTVLDAVGADVLARDTAALDIEDALGVRFTEQQPREWITPADALRDALACLEREAA